MPGCAVFMCKNTNRTTKGTGIKYFGFPKNEIIAKLWIDSCHRSDPINLKYASICSVHFDEYSFEVPLKDLEYYPKNSRHLRPDAIPTLHLNHRNCPKEEHNKQVNRIMNSMEEHPEATTNLLYSSYSDSMFNTSHLQANGSGTENFTFNNSSRFGITDETENHKIVKCEVGEDFTTELLVQKEPDFYNNEISVDEGNLKSTQETFESKYFINSEEHKCMKGAFMECEHIDSTNNPDYSIIKNEIEFEENSNSALLKQEIEFLNVEESKNISDNSSLNEKQIINNTENKVMKKGHLSLEMKEVVTKLFNKEKEQNPELSLNSVAKKVAYKTGICRSSVSTIIKEYKTTGTFSSPKVNHNRNRNTRINYLSDSDKNAIHQKVEDLIARNEIPFFSNILKAINDDPDLPNFKRSTFSNILKELKIHPRHRKGQKKKSCC